MTAIDCHCHIYPEKIAERAMGLGLSNSDFEKMAHRNAERFLNRQLS